MGLVLLLLLSNILDLAFKYVKKLSKRGQFLLFAAATVPSGCGNSLLDTSESLPADALGLGLFASL